MLDRLSGETRVHFIIGDPIAQVHSPLGVTRAFQARGHNAMLLPLQIPASGLSNFFRGIATAGNVDGLIVTIPHKMSCFRLCARTSARAAALGSVNVMRRDAEGQWYGDMFDGIACIAALRNVGCDIGGKRVLLVGAGGAGSAIAFALAEAGVVDLAIHDVDPERRSLLLLRLSKAGCRVARVGSKDPSEADVVINATPLGMRPGDPMPILVDRLSPTLVVSDVITAPRVSPLIGAARERGCRTQTGIEMAAAQCGVMADFLLHVHEATTQV